VCCSLGFRNSSASQSAAHPKKKKGKSSSQELLKNAPDLLRIPSEVVLSVLEASRGVLNPNQFLLLGSQQIEGLLCLFGTFIGSMKVSVTPGTFE
jgi:hypothetical protein